MHIHILWWQWPFIICALLWPIRVDFELWAIRSRIKDLEHAKQ
jgi:hypothetical protein